MPTNTDEQKIYIAFDFGMKRIGVAIGQMLTKTARPLDVIHAKNGIPNWTIVTQLIKKWAPNGLIVGIPLNMDGSQQPLSQSAYQFANELKERFSIPVHSVDERLTTKAAREKLFTQGGYKALQNGQVDSVAAQLILQNWFADQIEK